MNTNKPIMYIAIATMILGATGCKTESEKLDKEITREFKLERGTRRYRAGFNTFTRPQNRLHREMPLFMETSVRQPFQPFYNEIRAIGHQVPVGIYVIDGTKIEIARSNFGVPGYRGTQTQSCIIKNSSGTIDVIFEPYYSNNRNGGIAVLDARFDGHRYTKINSNDGAIIGWINQTVNNYMPIIDSIDNAEVKQYQDFRAKYIADRNEATVKSLKKTRLSR